MARIKGNIFGKITGKIGNLVFQMRGGEQLVKEYAENKNIEATEAQEIVRLKLATASRWAKQAGYYMQNMYSRAGTKKTTNFAELVKAVYYAVDDNYKIDFNKLKLNQIRQNDNLIIEAYYDCWTEYASFKFSAKAGTFLPAEKHMLMFGFCGYGKNGILLNEENNLKYCAPYGMWGREYCTRRGSGYVSEVPDSVLIRTEYLNFTMNGAVLIAVELGKYWYDPEGNHGGWHQYSTGGTYNTRYGLKDYGELVPETALIELKATQNTNTTDIEINFEEKRGKLESLRLYKKLYGENGQTTEYEAEEAIRDGLDEEENFKYTIPKGDIGDGLYIFIIAGYNEHDERVTDYYRLIIRGKKVITNYKEEEDYLLEHNHITPTALTIESGKKLLEYEALALKGKGEDVVYEKNKDGQEEKVILKNKIYLINKKAYTEETINKEYLIELKHYKDNTWISSELEEAEVYYIWEVKLKEYEDGKKTGEIVEFTSKDKNNNTTRFAPKGYKENENSKKYDIANELTLLKNCDIEILDKEKVKRLLSQIGLTLNIDETKNRYKEIVFLKYLTSNPEAYKKLHNDNSLLVYKI